jgi:molybdate transport system substrate-binding protein
MIHRRLSILLLACHPLAALPLAADTATIAVASNFIAPAEDLKARFETGSGHRLTLVGGSTGQLYAQILNGAPFDAFLAADRERPAELIADGLAKPESAFTYAAGRLVLWTPDPERWRPFDLDALRAEFRWLAIANPTIAPYGAAARQALERLGLWSMVENRVVQGQNIAQTFALVESRSADLGLVALSQALSYQRPAARVLVSETLHDPIRQDAVLLVRGAGSAAAREFLSYLRTDAARDVIASHRYSMLPER